MKKILAMDAASGREVDVKPLLHLVEDIFSHATEGTDVQVESLEHKTPQVNFTAISEELVHVVKRISCQIVYKVLGDSDDQSTYHSIFNMLSSYSWDAKLVLILAAFALNYGEYQLLSQIYSSKGLAKSMAILKHSPVVLQNSGLLEPPFEELKNIVRIMMDFTRCMVEFNEVPQMYIPHDVPALSAVMAQMPDAVYWTIRSVIACATQITSLTKMGHENELPLAPQKFATLTMEELELSIFAHKLNSIYKHLKEQIAICYKHIDEKRAFQRLVNLFDFEMVHIDNMEGLKALICAKDDQLPLVDGSTKTRVGLDVLRGKNVLLLISGLDISKQEIWLLKEMLIQSRRKATELDSQFEVVWIPIKDHDILWNDSMEKQFKTLQLTMPWYTVHHPSLIESTVIKFINEVWQYRNNTMVVVLDHQGRVVCPNAIHMMWIWFSHAFPFTIHREGALWKEWTWKIELLVDGIGGPTILNWIREGKCIILYGGVDIEWVKMFTTTARNIARAKEIPIEMVYVGKRGEWERVNQVISTITEEKLSYCWEDVTMIWLFWTRLESMLLSKMQLGNADVHDPVVQGVKKLLQYDKEGCWAMQFMGDNVSINDHRPTSMPVVLVSEHEKSKELDEPTLSEHEELEELDEPTLSEYEASKELDEPTLMKYEESKELDQPSRRSRRSLLDSHPQLPSNASRCSKFEYSSTDKNIPRNKNCPKCRHAMKKYISFVCCHDD